MVSGAPEYTSREARRFGVVLALALAAVGALLWWLRPGSGGGLRWSGGRVVAATLWGLALGVGLIAFVAPQLACHIQRGWMRFARAVGAVMTLVMFTALFVVILPVFALIRLRDPLRKRLGAPSYWEDHARDEDSLERALRPY